MQTINKNSYEIQAKFLGNFENNSPEWHALRDEQGVISGSEIGAILGLSPFTSAITLWAQKTGRLSSSFEPNTAMRLGQLVEPAIRTLYQEQHPEHEVYEVGTYAHKEQTWAHANPDALCFDELGLPYILEIKHTATYWDSVPEHYRAQVLWYMRVFGIKQAKLVALAGSSYMEFDIEWDEFEAQTLWDAAVRFRQACLEMKMPYWDGSNSTLETIRALSPGIVDTEVDLDDLGMHYLNSVDEYEKANAKMTDLKARVIQAMDGAKRGLIYGEHLLSLRSRAGGAPYLHHEKGK